MEEPTEWQLLIGQLAADALVRDALLVSLMEVIPDLHARIEAKVAVTAPGVGMGLPLAVKGAFQDRLAEVQALLANAYPSPDDATQ